MAQSNAFQPKLGQLTTDAPAGRARAGRRIHPGVVMAILAYGPVVSGVSTGSASARPLGAAGRTEWQAQSESASEGRGPT